MIELMSWYLPIFSQCSQSKRQLAKLEFVKSTRSMKEYELEKQSSWHTLVSSSSTGPRVDLWMIEYSWVQSFLAILLRCFHGVRQNFHHVVFSFLGYTGLSFQRLLGMSMGGPWSLYPSQSNGVLAMNRARTRISLIPIRFELLTETVKLVVYLSMVIWATELQHVSRATVACSQGSRCRKCRWVSGSRKKEKDSRRRALTL